MSDSFEPENIDVTHDAKCDSMHKGRQLVNPTLPIDIETVFGSMFQKSKFFTDFHNSRGTTILVQSEWEDSPDGTKKRVISMTIALSQVIGPKSMNVTETQIMRSCSIPGQVYSIDATSVNQGIPYADSFVVLLHYCMIRTVGDCTVMSVNAEIEYTKKMWGVIKTFIEKNTWASKKHEIYQKIN